MKTRGRNSAAALSLVPVVPLERVARPKAPRELTEEEADEWRAIVDGLPADWFGRETHSMLVALCRHVVAGNRVADIRKQIERTEPFDLPNYERVLRMQEREGRAISSLATKLRISHQSTYDQSKKKPTLGAKPWD